MTTYQICLAVNIEADSEEAAIEIAENLEAFLGMHHETSTLGTTTEIIELTEEEEEEEEVDEEFDNVVDSDDDLVEEYDPMNDVNYVGHPTHY